MCLFDVLCGLCESEGYHLHPVHVNHKFRPGAAELDQEYVEEICRRRGLECRTFVVDCNELAKREGLTSEEAGRKARYDAFFAVAQEAAAEVAQAAAQDGRPGVVIAVAQNANDQAETILFRMLRGTGIDGLAGIAYKRFERGIPVVRPLLDVPREEIEKYCEERNLSPRIDHTNSEGIYARNKIRLELLPLLREKFNPNIIDTINRLGKNAAADKDYLSRQALAAYGAVICRPEAANNVTDNGTADTQKQVEVFAAKLEELHSAVRIRVYNCILADIGMKENITEGQLGAIEKIMHSQSPSAMCDLADGFRVYKMYDRIRFCREKATERDDNADKADEQTGRNANADRFRMRFMTAAEYERQRAEITATGEQDRRPGELNRQDRRPGEPETRRPGVFGVFALPPGAEDKVCIRKRMDGDVIAIAAAGRSESGIRHKKLQDFFVDAKVPKSLRDEIDLLAYGNRILWVLPSPHFAREDYRKMGRFSAEFRPADRSGFVGAPAGILSFVGEKESAGAPAGELNNASETILVLEIL